MLSRAGISLSLAFALFLSACSLKVSPSSTWVSLYNASVDRYNAQVTRLARMRQDIPQMSPEQALEELEKYEALTQEALGQLDTLKFYADMMGRPSLVSDNAERKADLELKLTFLKVEVSKLAIEKARRKLEAMKGLSDSEPSKTVPPTDDKPADAPSKPVSATGSVAGTVFAPNGNDPVPNALVYVPEAGNAGLGKTVVYQPDESQALACGEPGEPYLAKTCSSATGSFSILNVPVGVVKIVIKKGFTLFSNIKVNANQKTQVAKIDSTLPTKDSERGSVPAIAVVTGSYDQLHTVLSKLGVEKRTMIDTPEKKRDFFKNLHLMTLNKMIMINCGSGVDELLKDQEVVENLREYVARGGRLYVTDRSNGFAQVPFAGKIQFAGNSLDGTAFAAAHTGPGGLKVSANVQDINLRNWLASGVRCGVKGSENCLNAAGQVNIEGFMGAWAVMEKAPNAKTYVEGDANGMRPLTVVFPHGKGQVLYSSYHTHHGGNANFIYPQERILEYFVFEIVK